MGMERRMRAIVVWLLWLVKPLCGFNNILNVISIDITKSKKQNIFDALYIDRFLLQSTL